ncbi:5-deoxy-glucuronate isomerase [Ahrensia sp. R2A130]|uniref:5-deoxy-glucuronate isomerase n=1 Tax=Ahrensia sp. R2A130 TaxID=744979 RepID=UPI0001E0F091|nr:5-deoxy-glucuronate isomerase [Ahrensia sp. R2A130]EFL89888.1 5-deoxy-glucuronate isomerase [Ahrensia sp. R2A130]
MSDLLIRPNGSSGKVTDVTIDNTKTPLSPDWNYVGFGLHRLAAGESVSEVTGDLEALLVIVEGQCSLSADGEDYGLQGRRMSVFDKDADGSRIRPVCLYVPNGTEWSATAETDVTLAVCTAPGKGGHPVRLLSGDDIGAVTRGVGANTRYIHPIAMEEQDFADSLLVTEVFTPAGNWSSYPPHRHDEDDFPRMTYLEETYYHRFDPPQGFGFQRVFTDDGSLDETMTVHNGDTVLVPKGHHPCGAPHGYDMYYLNVMAGPRRAWRFENHPEHEWIVERDAG